MSNLLSSYISCPKGIEPLLLDELQQLGGFTLTKQQVGGLYGQADLQTLYRICLHSRLANRVLLQLDQCKVAHKRELRDWLLSIDWASHMTADDSLHIRFFGELEGIRHTQYGAQFSKDAIVDFFRDRCGRRPSVDHEQPRLRFQIYVKKGRANCYLDLSGDSLHQRGYRTGVGPAPLKENLAAVLLIRAGWPEIASAGGALIDPLCGSGTLLTEGALIAANLAPGLLRKHFGFIHWRQHDPALWENEIENARSRINDTIPPIIGYDKDARALGNARLHINNLNLNTDAIRVYRKTIADWKKPSHISLIPGLLITNPPYGERLGNGRDLYELYKQLGTQWVNECRDWRAALFTSSPQLVKATRMYWNRSYVFYNGALKCRLYLLQLERGLKKELGMEPVRTELNEQVDIKDFANRIDKNRRRLSGWINQHNIECYRLYYSDIPEFALAIDMYRDWAVVQEFKPPKTVNSDMSRLRLDAVQASLPAILNVEPDHIVFKQRHRQKEHTQYEKQGESNNLLQVNEGIVKLLVDLHSYVDTGLFLDHRPLRLKLARLCRNKSFLNLFCYTAAATVHAAVGGAARSVSIDMSKTYIDWAAKNFMLNRIDTVRHELIRADILSCLKTPTEQFEVVFLDPPTFSNSKRMREILDIQRDHERLIKHTMSCVSQNGMLLFSCNFRKFRLDTGIQDQYAVKDITDWSIPHDFQRPGKIHHCFEIRHRD